MKDQDHKEEIKLISAMAYCRLKYEEMQFSYDKVTGNFFSKIKNELYEDGGAADFFADIICTTSYRIASTGSSWGGSKESTLTLIIKHENMTDWLINSLISLQCLETDITSFINPELISPKFQQQEHERMEGPIECVKNSLQAFLLKPVTNIVLDYYRLFPLAPKIKKNAVPLTNHETLTL